MVCIPCFIIPVLLYIWHKFIQPLMLRYWNPWEKKDEQGRVIQEAPKDPFECKDGVCRFAFGRQITKQPDSQSSVSSNSIESNSTQSNSTASSQSTASSESSKTSNEPRAAAKKVN